MPEIDLHKTVRGLIAEKDKQAKRIKILEDQVNLKVKSLTIGLEGSPYKITLAADDNVAGVWLSGPQGGISLYINLDGPGLQVVSEAGEVTQKF